MADAAKTLTTLDKDRDGKLVVSEIDDAGTSQPGKDGRKRRPGGPLMRTLDADGDGSLSPAEIDNAPAALKAADRDRDGRLTREEVDGGGDRRGLEQGGMDGPPRN
ncbi:MAG TPA: hypothetical protein PLU30_03395 [Verrucomicrobiae bacterium]|nr:hypothetical protein [Verrucomicrobiae bacterium]